MGPTESQHTTATQLKRIAWLSGKDPSRTFSQLMHHVNVESLTDCYQQLDGNKAVGIDQVTKTSDGEQLTENLSSLIAQDEANGLPPGAGTTGSDTESGKGKLSLVRHQQF